MRPISAATEQAWRSGLKTGPNRPVVRVTIQPMNVALFPYDTNGRRGEWASMMFNQSQTPVELPNVKAVSWDRSVEQDVASCSIELFNTEALPLGETPAAPAEIELPGFFTFARGVDPANRWGYEPNGWRDRLVPDRIVRVYEGYGADPTVAPENDPHLYLTGTWLIDDVAYSTDGLITLRCRDMGRELIETIYFPPAVPFDEYGQPWVAFHQVDNPPQLVPTSGWTRIAHETDSNQAYIGKGYSDGGHPYVENNGAVRGHHGNHAFDNSARTFWMSVGNMPNWSSAYEYVQGQMSPATVTAVRIRPWGGPYTVYVSVFSNGKWRGRQKIPYRARSVNTHANIRYMASGKVKKDTETVITVPAVANATKIRITFHDLYNSHIGQYPYRAGCYSVEVAQQSVTSVPTGTHREGNYGDLCVDTDTMILTRRGWLTCEQVQPGDRAYSLNPATGLGEWDEVIGVYRKHRRRVMMSMQSATHSSVTTDDHRWLVRDRDGDWVWRTSSTLTGGDRIPIAAPVGESPVQQFSDHFVDTVAAWCGLDPVSPRYARAMNASLSGMLGDPDAVGWLLAWALDLVPGARVDSRWWQMDVPGDRTRFMLSSPVRDLLHRHAPDRCPTPGFLLSLTPAQLHRFLDGIDFDHISPHPDRVRAFQMAAGLAGRPVSTRAEHGPTYPWLRHDHVRPGMGHPSFKVTQVDYEGVVWCPRLARNHNWFALREGTTYFTGNTDVVRQVLAWGGFYWPPAAKVTSSDGSVATVPPPADPVLPVGSVWGDFENTGTTSETELSAAQFDKKPLIDVIAYVRDLVAYLFHIDEWGGAVFRSPNIWAPGNYVSGVDGGAKNGRVASWITLDEANVLLSNTVTLTSQSRRDKLFVASSDGQSGAVVAGFNPYPSGTRRVAGWTDAGFKNEAECRVMADLIALRMLFKYRAATLTIPGNPAIQIDDQVRLVERVTAQTHLYYVSAVSSKLDMMAGKWTYELTAHWLGEPGDWAFSPSDLSPETQAFLATIGKL